MNENRVIADATLVEEADRVRLAMDLPFPAPAVGDDVRNVVHRSVGVVEEVLENKQFRVRYDDGRVFEEPQAALLPVGKCSDCHLPQQKDRPCMQGHVQILKGAMMKAIIGDLLDCKSEREGACVGTLLVSMIGDALGAPFEGHGAKTINHNTASEGPTRFYSGTQMGVRELVKTTPIFTKLSFFLIYL